MRIAVSGTHFIGKTTFINDLIAQCPTYTRIEEPYYQMAFEWDFDHSEGANFDQAVQLIYASMAQIEEIRDNQNVIFDRCPIDYLAYALCALHDDHISIHETEASELLDDIIEAVSTLDMILFLPISNKQSILYTEDNPEFRALADEYFKKIYREDLFSLFPNYNQPSIIELTGSRKERIKIVKALL